MTLARKVVVAGTRFGEHYLAALARDSRRPGASFQGGESYELAGIVAQGSERSRAIAAKLGVPMFQAIDALPRDIDTVCVVVRSRIVGGQGSALAEAALRRGYNVVQEHPVHPSDARAMFGLAKEQGVTYAINTLYPNLPHAGIFTDFVASYCERKQPAFIELTTSLQLLYSALDILQRGLGPFTDIRVQEAQVPEGWAQSPRPFKVLYAEVAGIPVTVNLQTTLDPSDPDHHSYVMHRISLGDTEGQISLASSFGPVTWSHSIYAEDYASNSSDASWLLNPEKHQASRFNTQPLAICLGSTEPRSLAQAVAEEFPAAILKTVAELHQTAKPAWLDAAYWQSHGEFWLAVMRNVGMPTNTSFATPRPPYPDPLAFAQNLAATNRVDKELPYG